MVFLLELCGEMTDRITAAVKDFLNKMWYTRSRETCMLSTVFAALFSLQELLV